MEFNGDFQKKFEELKKTAAQNGYDLKWQHKEDSLRPNEKGETFKRYSYKVTLSKSDAPSYYREFYPAGEIHFEDEFNEALKRLEGNY